MTLAEQFENLEKTIKSYNMAADFDAIRASYEYAAVHHEGQLRKTGEPYIIHPLAVAQIVAEMRLDSESIQAALLHDCIEDTNATHEEIARLFSPTVADLVEGVTKLTRVQFSTKEDEQMENLRKMLLAMSKDIRVILIKIADRLHNMRTMEYQSSEKQRTKSLETMEIYAPIAHRLGMQKVKWELEDRSLEFLDPIGFKEINDFLKNHLSEHQAFMCEIQTQIEKRLAEMHIEATVYGRIKHTYSIYRKMMVQEKTIDQVLDLFAFRVLVNDIPDCYNVLGVVHDLYKPILGRFKDYIGTPKPNMYQSLHTTVMGTAGIPFEVQIRTYDMHATAEYGVAAHWKYKSNGEGKGDEKNYEWVRKLLENQEGTDAEEYIHSLKVDLFSDEVFVFTPAGDVVNLPAGSNPIDFAYAIHSAVGNKMIGARVNGRMVSLEYKLNNGDVVEVITSKAARGPSRDWIKLAQSSEARSKIRQWFKKERKDENVANGRSAFESELKHCGITMTQIIANDILINALKRMNFKEIDEMYAAIGYGGITTQKVINRLRDEMRKISQEQESPEKKFTQEQTEPVPIRNEVPIPTKAEKGITVEGLDNCLIKFARCCTPVPGDPIVGFITRGYGVSIHRKDCPNAACKNPEEGSRWVKVSWGDDIKEIYPTSIQLMAKDRPNLLLDITAVLGSIIQRLNSINARSTPDEFALIDINFCVKDKEQLDMVMRKLNQISGVVDVKRTAG